MNSRTIQLALKIALLLEEYSETEIQKAAQLLEEKGSSSKLLASLKVAKSSRGKQVGSPSRTKRVDEQRSMATIMLEHDDPEKYQIMAEIDGALRRGDLLPRLEDIVRLGDQLSKGFAPRKSRREAISKFVALVANRSIDDIKRLHSVMINMSSPDNKGGYQKLARFIIGGGDAESGKKNAE